MELGVDQAQALAFCGPASCGPAGVVLQSRQQRWLTDAFPDVTAALAVLAEEQVVLDELVVWRAGRFDFPSLQDRLRSGPARVHALALAAPAAYVVFDLLAHRSHDLRGNPYAKRRRRLEKLLATRGLPPGVVLTPTTTDPTVARSWLRGHSRIRDRGRGRQTRRPALPTGGAGLAETPRPPPGEA